MKFYKKLNFLVAVAAVVAIVGLSLIGCSPAEAEESGAIGDTYEHVVETGKLNVGFLMSCPPMTWLDEDGVGQGYTHIFFENFGNEMGWEIEKLDVQAVNAIPSLLTGESDVDAGLNAQLPVRSQSVIATIYPYFMCEQVVLGFEGDEINGWDDLSGYTLGVAIGTQGEFFAINKDLEAKGVKIQRFDDDTLLQNAIIAKQVDAITTINLNVIPMVIDNPELGLDIKFNYAKIGGHFMFRLNDNHLREIFDAFIYVHYLNGDMAGWWEEATGFPLGNFPGLYTPGTDYNELQTIQ